MSYQVLARKWRPKNFQQLMGQEHVVNVLANALSQQRLHHAYLFTGTRGVGKTTIARIFAKSLNCQLGITDKPCGKCDACIDIDQGRFVDLLEIDAASKTKVDDTREILDNVQYAPSRGRFKVYLIDEVHMLSRHSFNALLKTLEEPPEHVKFILATTDPQKLPITVLSRCLQFHLKALTVNQIEDKLAEILSQEQVSHEPGCLTLLAKAARGSMRDSLSLTDQAIAQGQGNISLANIQQMLGGIDQNWVYQLLIALLKQDSQELMALSQEIAGYAPSYSRLFAELIQLFHQIALLQIVDQHFDLPADLLVLLKKFSQAMSPEDVQLYYQISLNGRKDLPYAFDEQAAFDMTLLRLLAFKPMQKSALTDVPSIDNESSMADLDVVDSTDKNTQLNNIDISNANSPKPTVASSNIDTRAEPRVEQNEEPVFEKTRVEKLDNVEAEYAPETQVDMASDYFHRIENDANTTLKVDETEANIQSLNELNQLNELNEQMLAIEQQATEFNDNTFEQYTSGATQAYQQPAEESAIPAEQVLPSTIQTPSDNRPASLSNEQAGQLSIDSPVGSVLATRNMLRSRKKALEKQTKKSSDATLRQPNNGDSTNIDTSVKLSRETQSITVEPLVIAPEPDVVFHQDNIDPTKITKANQVDKWAHMIDSMQLTARVRQLAINATISENSTDDNLILKLNQATKHLNTDFAQQQLQSYICEYLSRKVTVTLDIVEETVADPYQIQVQINDKRLEYAKGLIKEDDFVQALQNVFQAQLSEESISPR
ncbi:DNA polymerase III subunit gamma/tau [Colwellia ponticola]|uniref:DNA polymerase III subunit gamma/tau n=1 Tax=Colwellia ponticola TaxID=2304625 RepID=A0A8H2JND8_9GAMM|nr:DNA polymerase III subunit gamma/tau [Colwellia ponticola]TMM46821.1 DNA polymerase III subunit gamma/tau [Colwellia ponticola]